MLELIDINTFYGKAKALHDLNFQIPSGQVVALLGRNGAGKSTTLKTIMQILIPQSGQIIFEGQEITKYSPFKVARMGIGYVPEDRRIFTDLTVAENMEVGRRESRSDAVNWDEEILFELFPNLLSRRKNLGKTLSGGEQQMLTIARTLMGNPKLILLDEPSEGVAPVIVKQMIKIIQQLKSKGLTILMSEQNLHFAKAVADVVIIIERGEKKFHGSLSDLESQPEVSNTYLAA